MSVHTAEERIRELAQGLAPVRPIPRLRSAWIASVALGCAAPAVSWLIGGPGLRPVGAAMASSSYLLTLGGLAGLALAALAAACAAAVPGREPLRRLGTRLAAAGAGLALAGALWGIALRSAPGAGETLGAVVACLERAALLGAAPTLIACAFIAFAAPQRSRLGTALALAGGVGLGAVAVHITCPSDSALHWLLAHAIAPLIAALALTAPLAALVARVRR